MHIFELARQDHASVSTRNESSKKERFRVVRTSTGRTIDADAKRKQHGKDRGSRGRDGREC